MQYAWLLATITILPFLFVWSIGRSRDPDRVSWILKLLYASAFLAYLALVSRWDLLSYPLRYVFLVLLIVVAVRSFVTRVRRLPWRAGRSRSWVRQYGLAIVLVVLFTGFLAAALRGRFFDGTPADLRFPLQDGSYYVGQGGNHPFVNYHNVYPAQRYALDIVALSAAGARATGLYPSELSRYVIFGEAIYSPCDGQVVTAADGLPDRTPPDTDTTHIAGNHVILACDGVEVLLAHMRQGSVAVQPGDAVRAGITQLGEVGNSGNTSEPHLHVHAVRAGSGGVLRGSGVPMLFDGRFLVRNSVVRAE